MSKLTECRNVNCFQGMFRVGTERLKPVSDHHETGKKMFMQFLIIWHLCGSSDVIMIEKTHERTSLFKGVGTILVGKAMARPKSFRLF